MTDGNKNKELAYLILRVALAVDLLMHGLVRVGEGYGKFVTSIVEMFANTPLPVWSVSALAHVIPVLEFG
jgi:uncharacterized membrane protein YphA (DoxX/SURF4 family)